MALPRHGFVQPTEIVDANGVPARVADDGTGIWRLAVDALIDGGDIEIGAVELKDGATDERASVKPSGTALSAAPNNGGLLVAGNNSGTQRDIAVDASGRVITAAGTGLPNKSDVTFQVATVVTAATPVQGPSITVPDGFALRVRQRVSQSGTRIGYVGKSAAAVIVSTTRSETVKGDILTYYITNANLLWFDSDTSGTIFEFTVEQ